MKPDKQVKNRKSNGQWEKGTSGNPQGRPKSRTLSEAYRDALNEPLPDGSGLIYADMVAKTLCRKAAKGNIAAARALADPEIELQERTAYNEVLRVKRQREGNPVQWGESEPAEQPEQPGETWTVGGRKFFVPDSAPDSERAPQIEPVIKRGIQYTRPQGPRTIRTWED